jgi:hypothetical protein
MRHYYLENNERLYKALSNISFLLLISWIYLGFIRLYLLPGYAKYLFFIPSALCLLIGILSLSLRESDTFCRSLIFFYFAIVVVFQAFHVILLNLDIKIALYGISLYQLPFFILAVSPLLAKKSYVESLAKILYYSIFPNLILCILQTYSAKSSFVRSTNDFGQLGTTSGFTRAYGTFSSTSGFSLYILIIFSFAMASNSYLFSKFRSLATSLVLIMILISGSRTVIFSVLQVIIFGFLIRNTNLNRKTRIKSNQIITLVISAFFTVTFFGNTLSAFLNRFLEASQQENTIKRIVNQATGQGSVSTIDIFGSGLASRCVGTFDYYIFAGWIESEIPRILTESGIILGVLLILLRYFILFKLIIMVRKKIIEQSKLSIYLVSVITPYLIYGSVFGQGTISVGTLLCIFIILIIIKENDKSKLS